MKNKDIKRRIIDISYRHKLSHLGSCLTAVDIIDDIYQQKKSHEPFILSNGHAGLALYCVLEKYEGHNAEELFNLHGVHPNRDMQHGIWCSTGSLGHGLPIAVGMALADETRNVYCLVSDGECAEGSIAEALRVMEDENIPNLWVSVNHNGYSAYEKIGLPSYILEWADRDFVEVVRTDVDEFPSLQGLNAHYYVMNEEDYQLACKILE